MHKERRGLKKLHLSKNSIATLWNTARFAAYLLAIFLTPLLAKPLGILFDPVVSDWWQHGQLRIFYTELITAFLWLGEIIAFFFLDRHLQKKYNVQIDGKKPLNPQNKKEKTPLLSMDRVVAVFLISVACVLLISAQIGFQVKVFYELGERVILSDVVNFSGTAGRNIVKCGWIVLLMKASFGIFENVFESAPCKPTTKKVYVYLCVTLLTLLFGVYDVISSQNPFWWTYLIFYAAFVALYVLVRKAPIKSYLLILFIYFF